MTNHVPGGLKFLPSFDLDEEHTRWTALAIEMLERYGPRDGLPKPPLEVVRTFAGVKSLARRQAAERISSSIGNSETPSGNCSTVSTMTTAEVAGALSLKSTRQVINLVEAGALSGERDARGHWRIHRHSVLAEMQRRGHS